MEFPDAAFLTLDEASRFLGVHKNTLRLWDKKGMLKAIRFGIRKDRQYSREDVIAFAKKRRNEKGHESKSIVSG